MQFLEQERKGWSRLRFCRPKPNAKRVGEWEMVRSGSSDYGTVDNGVAHGRIKVILEGRTKAEEDLLRESLNKQDERRARKNYVHDSVKHFWGDRFFRLVVCCQIFYIAVE